MSAVALIMKVKFWGGNRKENDMDEKTELKSQNISFLNQEICIEAKVTVNPDVSVGKVKIECVESEIEPCSKSKSDCEECTIMVRQLIRVQIPITFSATADAVPIATSCNYQDLQKIYLNPVQRNHRIQKIHLDISQRNHGSLVHLEGK